MGDDPSPGLSILDASWRSDYIDAVTATERSSGLSTSEETCVFCSLLRSDRPDDETLIVHREEHAFVVLNAYPYSSGHLLVLPTEHRSSLPDLATDEHSALFSLVSKASTAIDKAYRPDGQNIGVNLGRAAGAGIPGHLHVHVLPRWSGDTNFMTSVAMTRVAPESVSRSWAKLRAVW